MEVIILNIIIFDYFFDLFNYHIFSSDIKMKEDFLPFNEDNNAEGIFECLIMSDSLIVRILTYNCGSIFWIKCLIFEQF